MKDYTETKLVQLASFEKKLAAHTLHMESLEIRVKDVADQQVESIQNYLSAVNKSVDKVSKQ